MDATLREKLVVFSTSNPNEPFEPNNVDPFEEARETAFAEGRDAGIAAAEQQAEAEGTQTEQAILEMADQLNNVVADIEQSHGRAIYKALQVILPAIVEQEVLTQVKNTICAVSVRALEGKIRIRTSAAFAKELSPVLMKVEHARRFSVEPDATIKGYAVQLAWEGGGGEIDLEAAIIECLDILKPGDAQSTTSPQNNEERSAP